LKSRVRDAGFEKLFPGIGPTKKPTCVGFFVGCDQLTSSLVLQQEQQQEPLQQEPRQPERMQPQQQEPEQQLEQELQRACRKQSG